MDLGYTEFQELLRQTARDFVSREALVSRHRARVKEGATFDGDLWEKMADLGWPGLLVPEVYGGGGGHWADVLVLLEELGRGLAPYHLLAQMLTGLIIAAYGSEAQRQALLTPLARGKRRFATAFTEVRTTLDPAGIQCQAVPVDEGFWISGVKHFVRGASAADALVVAARLGEKLGLFLVDRRLPGLEAVSLPNLGDDDLQRLTFHNVWVPTSALLGGIAQGWEALERTAEWGALLECGYAVGLMARDVEMTVTYVRNRVQFGRPIGAFQAVQHQVADQVTDVDISRLLTFYAAWDLDRGSPAAPVAIARAKAWVSDALRRVARTGNQLHGGIGFSTEYDLHFYYQRAKLSELMFEAADRHREAVAAALLDREGPGASPHAGHAASRSSAGGETRR